MVFHTRLRAWPLATAILAATGVVTAVIVLGIVLVLLGANQHNVLVDSVLDIARWFVQPFRDLFPQINPKQDVFVNWGIAAVAYFLLGGLFARLVRRS
jgi:hypothetical protein